MGDYSPYAHRLRDGSAAQQHILKQRSTDAPMLVIAIDRKPSQDEDRHRSLCRLAFQQSLCRVVWLNLPDCQRVVANDAIPAAGYEGSRRTGLSVPRVAMKPAVKCVFLAAKVAKVVLSSQRLRLRVPHGLLEDAWLGEKLSQPAGDTRWPIEQLRELRPLGLIERELRPVGQNTPRLCNGSDSNEAAELGVGQVTRGPDKGILRLLDAHIPTQISGLPGLGRRHSVQGIVHTMCAVSSCRRPSPAI
jgi:hypothetical protein